MCGLCYAIVDCVLCAWSVPRGYERIREWELTSLDFRSFKGRDMWPEEELEDLACDVTYDVVHRYLKCVI
jgi:hypothetical protein